MQKYRCVCEKGYQLDHTGKKCIDIDECEDPNVCTNGGICRNFPGSFQCICPKGSTFNETSKICVNGEVAKYTGIREIDFSWKKSWF